MAKARALKTFLQVQSFTTYNKFKSIGHAI